MKAMTVSQPQKFGKYQLMDKIATGGMAELYRAKLTGAEGFEKLIAIKKILPHLSCEGELVKAFIDEAKLAALLQHESIVQIYDFGNLEGEYFIAMEYLFGKDLRTVVKRANERDMPLGLENILYIASKICAGLDYSHHLNDLQGQPLNIIHRDVNPQNIFITYAGQVKIIDFGIAKAASHNTTTHEGLIKGKLAYMSPEQANGEIIDHRSDIYSTGIILYELLADKRMFEGEALHIYPRVRLAQYEPPEKLITNVPSKLYDILHRALAKEREDRYQSGGDMLADLEECIYQSDSRSNTRSLSRYIKSLFKEEFAAEELTLWAKSQILSAGEAPDPEQSTATEQYGKTVVLPGIPAPVQHKGGFWRLSMMVGLVVLAMIADLSFFEMPFTGSTGNVAAYSTDNPVSDTPAEDERIQAAKASMEDQNFEQALMIFDKILADDPSQINIISYSYVDALLGEATRLINADPELARGMLLKALEIDPRNVDCLTQLGFIYTAQNNHQKAIEIYQAATAINPQFAGAFFNLGYLYQVTGDYVRAKEMYQRVIDLNPKFVDEALFNLAMIQAHLGNQNACVKNLEQAIAINPDNESARKYLQGFKGGSKRSDES
jgi:serine/threonine protein kinase